VIWNESCHTYEWVMPMDEKLSWECCGTCHSTQKKHSFSNMYPLLLFDHWGLIHRKSWVYTRKSKMLRKSYYSPIDAILICIHFYWSKIGVSFTGFKTIETFQWIPLSKNRSHESYPCMRNCPHLKEPCTTYEWFTSCK